ncbi:MAG: rhodanese-like domain-containing protein [Verrucomicrobiaceae bacterium]|nr:MAG: rhodanese-like domain-containing protein [Verrucomicrobiaceae bacterium]
MRELLVAYPGAQRAMFRHFHIGGCASCGFAPEEKLSDVCARNEGVSPEDVLKKVRESHEQDEKVLIPPALADEAVRSGGARLLDIRTREEFEAVHIDGAELFSQDLLQTIMGGWPKETPLIVCDHTGTRCLDAAAYFSGHGFLNVRALKGGIDAWCLEVNPSLPRYSVE